MTCMSCVAKVKSELLKLGDVASADVRLQSPQATIVMNKHIPITVLKQAVVKAGNYSIEETSDHAGMSNHQMSMVEKPEEQGSYFPIVLIFGYIAGVVTLIQVSGDSPD